MCIRDSRCRELTDKPFGVNIMLMNPAAPEMAKIVAEEHVPVVTTGAGNPGAYVPMWKEAGIRVFPVVAATVLARRLAGLGVDGVIAEGTESGGHVGEMTTMALVPQVVDAMREFGIPVIAAGGIADGRQLAAAFALGAVGAQLGTCLLASAESVSYTHLCGLRRLQRTEIQSGGTVRRPRRQDGRDFVSGRRFFPRSVAGTAAALSAENRTAAAAG